MCQVENSHIKSGVGNSFGFAGHIRDKLGIRGPGHIHVNLFQGVLIVYTRT